MKNCEKASSLIGDSVVCDGSSRAVGARPLDWIVFDLVHDDDLIVALQEHHLARDTRVADLVDGAGLLRDRVCGEGHGDHDKGLESGAKHDENQLCIKRERECVYAVRSVS